MIPVSNRSPNGRVSDFIEDMTEGLTDGVTFELMTQAVDLRCGHSYNESTIVNLSKDPAKYLCPECRAPITEYKANFTIRRLAGRVVQAPALAEPEIHVPQFAEPVNNRQLEEAEEYFKRGRALCDQGKQEEGVTALFKALELNPNHEKAHSYLEFVTDTKHKRRSSLSFTPEAPKPSAPPLEIDEPHPLIPSQSQLSNDGAKANLRGQEEPPSSSPLAGYRISSARIDWAKKNYFSTIDGIELTVSDEEREAYGKVFELVLQHEIYSGKLNPGDPDSIDDFNIPSSLYATYTNPGTGNEQGIDLLAIEDMEVRTVVDSYFKIAGMSRVCPLIRPHSKGNHSGPLPLNKKFDPVLMKLPNNLEHTFQKLLPQKLLELPSPAQRNVFSRRLLFIEYFYSQLCEKIATKLMKRELALKEPGNDRQKKALLNEIQKLKGLREKLNNFDFYAISKALITFPIEYICSVDLDVLAEKLKNQVETEILDNQSWWEHKRLNPIQIEYAQDVAGMLYIDRGKYFKYCTKVYRNSEKKNEGAVDIFMREAIQFANGKEYSAEGFKKSSLLYDFGEELKIEMQKEFDALAVLANYAIGHGQGNEYEIAVYPPNTPPDVIDQQRRDVLKKHIAAHRLRVKHAIAPESSKPLAASKPAAPPLEDNSLLTQAKAYKKLNQYSQAKKCYQQALALNPDDTEVQFQFAKLLYKLADYTEARKYVEKAQSVAEGKNEDILSRNLNLYGLISNALGDTKNAIEHFTKALMINKERYGNEHPKVASILTNFGWLWQTSGDVQKAIRYHEEALRINMTVYGAEHPDVATCLHGLGYAWSTLGDAKKAVGYFEEALKIHRMYGDEHPKLADCLYNLGAAWQFLEDAKKAVGYFEEALKIYKKVHGDDHPKVAMCLKNLGSTWKASGYTK